MRGPAKLYAILDTALLRGVVSDDELEAAVQDCAAALLASGVETLQLRAKEIGPRRTLTLAGRIKATVDSSGHHGDLRNDNKEDAASHFGLARQFDTSCHPESNEGPASNACARKAQFILNDRPDLALLADFDGCHLGQQDLSIAGARKILPRPKLLGLSTHNQRQLEAAMQTEADYIAIGPIFATASKQNPEPVVGLHELARLRKLTTKPLVAIGGITRANARAVLDAGADSVAILGDVYRDATNGRNLAQAVTRNVADILDAIR